MWDPRARWCVVPSRINPTGSPAAPFYGVDAAFMQLQGVLHNFRKRCGWQGQDAGRRLASRAVFVMLAMRRYPHEARAALASGGRTR